MYCQVILDSDKNYTRFFQKFREYVLNSNRMSRLQAKYDHIRVTLGDQASHPAEGNFTLTRRQNTSRRWILLLDILWHV